MTDEQEKKNAEKIMWRGLITLGIIWAIGLTAFIYHGETTLWASEFTKSMPPNIEITP